MERGLLTCDTLSRWKGMETNLHEFCKLIISPCDTLSRLKGIETMMSASRRSGEYKLAIRFPGGREWKLYLLRRQRGGSYLRYAFPVEGN